jgi:hypothetical protein
MIAEVVPEWQMTNATAVPVSGTPGLPAGSVDDGRAIRQPTARYARISLWPAG